MRPPSSSSAARPPLLLLLVMVAVSPAAGSWQQPLGACRACCSAIMGAYCPSWCPPCQTQCPAPQLTSCPIVPEPEPRRCRNNNCPGGQRCCFNGCRVVCQPVCRAPCPPGQRCSLDCQRPPCSAAPRCVPIHLPTCRSFHCPSGSHCVLRGGRPKCEQLSSSRPGTCPVNDRLPFTSCPVNATDQCSEDNSCGRNQKCCNYGCARTCVPACLPTCRSDQKCVLKRSPGPCLGKTCDPPVSTCEVNDPCAVVRCGFNTQCVVRDGKANCEPPTIRPGTCPANDVISSCLQREDKCISDTQCERGEKCCSRGCGRECRPACQTPCPSGQTCKIVVFPCLIPPCPEGPRCVVDDSVEKPGVCPINDIITTCQVLEDACISDAECKGDEKCCSRGCGRTCVPNCPRPCPRGQTCKIPNVQCYGPSCNPSPRCVVDDSVEKPGVCPIDNIITTCQVREDACISDAECKGDEKCCSRGCGRTCVPACPSPCPRGQTCKITVTPCLVPPCPEHPRCIVDYSMERPQVCPINDIITTCQVREDTCTFDAECKRTEKCCSHGCGRTCVPACPSPCPRGQTCKVTVAPCLVPPCPELPRCVVDDSVEKPGVCPINDIITTCEVREDACISDAECKGDEKCCSRGCGRTCVPTCPRPCPRGQTCKIPNVQCFGPSCNPSPRCVVDDSVEKPGVCPLDNIITTCQVREDSCISDAECKGDEKCCSRGCGRTCVPTCPSPCPRGQTCKIPNVQCFGPSCNPSPRCMVDNSVERPGVCPLDDIITTCQVRADACSSDSQCESGQKCCSRGCGRTCVAACKTPCSRGEECKLAVVNCLVPPCPSFSECQPVHGPVIRPGSCPRDPIRSICSERWDACTSDAQCTVGQKCCTQGCGRKCVTVQY